MITKLFSFLKFFCAHLYKAYVRKGIILALTKRDGIYEDHLLWIIGQQSHQEEFALIKSHGSKSQAPQNCIMLFYKLSIYVIT